MARKKTERLYIDANKSANVRRDVMKKNKITDAELHEIKNEAKTIIKKIKEKLVATEQPESESENEEILVGFDTEGEPVMLKECKLVVEDLLCDSQERNDIHIEDQNNINKDDECIAKNFEEISKLKEVILNKLSNVRERTSKKNSK